MTQQQLFIREFGKPEDVLGLETDVTLIRAPGDVVVKVHAAPINPADLNWIEGTYGVRPELPATPGIEGFGWVEESSSPDFVEGDPVIFLGRVGTWANRVAVQPEPLLKIPADVDPLQAAMLKVNPATAWQLLHAFRKIEPGGWVVQNAGNSGVGRCLIQIARELGIRTISMVRNPALLDELEALGADHVFTDDADGLSAALDAMGGRRANLACNAVGGESALRLMNLLADGAAHVTYGAMARRPLTVPNGLLIFRDLSIHGLWVSRWIDAAPATEREAVYGTLAEMAAQGKLVQPVDGCFPLADFKVALARQHAADRHGKVMLGGGGAG